jgi:TctA family transporter
MVKRLRIKETTSTLERVWAVGYAIAVTCAEQAKPGLDLTRFIALKIPTSDTPALICAALSWTTEGQIQPDPSQHHEDPSLYVGHCIGQCPGRWVMAQPIRGLLDSYDDLS